MRTFYGKTSGEALARVREELGPDACVMETRRGPRGVEVVAAAERPGPRITRPLLVQRALDSAAARRLAEDLTAYGYSPALAERIAAAAESNLDEDQLADRPAALSYARELLALWLPAAPPAPPQGEHVLALVGAPGTGKTTTLAKLTARELFQHGRRVVLATCDTRRLGGAEQCEAYARVFGVPFVKVTSRRELDGARALLGGAGTLYLDTPGAARGDRLTLDRLVDLLAAIDREQIELVLAADADPEAMLDAVRRFAPLAPGRCCATRIDEAVRPGALVSVLARSGLPVAHVGCGPDVPDDLVDADPRALAQWALPLPGDAPVATRRGEDA